MELAARLRASGAAVCLLSELDAGMARTENEDTPTLIATDLGAGYVFGVEFVELGLGDEAEQRAAAGPGQRAGAPRQCHRVAGSSRRTGVVRLPESGPGWFAAESPQPRVGGRVAVLATVGLDGVPVQLASTHLENRTDAAHRAEQMEVLLRAVDERGDGGPAIVGGDLNTLGAPTPNCSTRRSCDACAGKSRRASRWPVAHEPLFEVARAHGFEWTDANVAAPTTDHDAVGLPDHVPIRLDWLLVRGLVARRPAVIPAGGLSDHMASRSACDSHDGDHPSGAAGRRGRDPRRGREEPSPTTRGTRTRSSTSCGAPGRRGRRRAHRTRGRRRRYSRRPSASGAGLARRPRRRPWPAWRRCAWRRRTRASGSGSALVGALVHEAEERDWPLLLLLGDPGVLRPVRLRAAARSASTTGRSASTTRTSRRDGFPAYTTALRGEFSYCWE